MASTNYDSGGNGAPSSNSPQGSPGWGCNCDICDFYYSDGNFQNNIFFGDIRNIWTKWPMTPYYLFALKFINKN